MRSANNILKVRGNASTLVGLLFLSSYCIPSNTLTNISEAPPISTSVLVGDSVKVTKVPPSFGYNLFYKKHIDASGISILSSEKVPDEALIQARKIIIQMLSKIPEVKAKLVENKLRVAVMAFNEKTTDIPEHSDLNVAFPDTNWDTRARGLGATLVRPAVSCAEENLLCYSNDVYRGEDILVHEFAHGIHQLGISFIDIGFDKDLTRSYESAKREGLWQYTYAISNRDEYFAEGVQCWFNVNKEAIPADGIHNEINTRKELSEYDPKLFNLISKYFYDDNEKMSCQIGQ